MTNREVMQQALRELEGIPFYRKYGVRISNAITTLRTALEQQQAEPVSVRMPKVGDKVICLEDESLGEVVSLTAGGSPDIVFDDGTRGTYLLREFAELFGYAEQRQQQAEPPPEWPLIKNILDVFGLDAIAFVAAWKAAQQQAEPVAWTTMPEAEDWCFVSGGKDPNGKLEGKWFPLYTAPPQRQWQGLTEDEFLEACQLAERGNYLVAFQRIQIKLKERNT